MFVETCGFLFCSLAMTFVEVFPQENLFVRKIVKGLKLGLVFQCFDSNHSGRIFQHSRMLHIVTFRSFFSFLFLKRPWSVVDLHNYSEIYS